MSTLKVKVKNAERGGIKFPRLMQIKGGGFVVLFTTPSIGTVVASDTATAKVGLYEEYWDFSKFEDFKGTIELTQE